LAGLAVFDDAYFLSLLFSQVIHLFYSFWGSPFSWWLGLALIGVGITFLIIGFRNTVLSIFTALLPDHADRLVDLVYQRQSLGKGPKIVAIGGGTGIPALLRGLKNYTSNITAIVTVADDGGSSGRLRWELGILPPGDIRNCLAALAETETLMDEVLNYRFNQGEGLEGHSLGNLILAGLTQLSGRLDVAIRELSRVLAVRGKVLPSTLDNAQLCAEYKDGTVVQGESRIPDVGKPIKRVFLNPKCELLPEAGEAIKNADLIILGPGSLYTSVMPNLLVEGMVEALQASKAPLVYVCNIMTQGGETDGYTVSDHLKALISHMKCNLIKYVVVNKSGIASDIRKKYEAEKSFPVKIDKKAIEKLGVKILEGRILNRSDLARHDGEALARLIIRQSLLWKKK
jgi:uncharacterized cofD-like protein